MAAKFKVGEKVKQVQPKPVQGEVVRVGIHNDDLGFLVRDASGEEWWFTGDQLEAVTEA